MLLTRAGAAKKLQEAVTCIDNSSSIPMTTTASLAPSMLTAKNTSHPSTAASLAPSMLKDPPEGLGLNYSPRIEFQMAAANEGDCLMEARSGLVVNVRNKGRLNDPPQIEYQMAAANEGDCFMEARGGLVENVQNKGGGLKDPPEGLGLIDPPPIEYQIEVVDYIMGDSEPMDDTSSTPVDIIGDQWNLKKKKIFFGGHPYKCNKVRGDPEKKGSTIIKYYSCQMVLFNREGERWKPLQLPKGSFVDTMSSVESPKKKSSVESPKKKTKTDTVLTYNICKGTLHGSFSMVRGKMKHLFRAGNINHICHNPTWVKGTTLDIREPLMFIVSSVHWQITDALINSVKQSLESTKSGWAPLGHCGSARHHQ